MTLALGYKLSSEEQSPGDLVRYAQMAEDTGFAFALISDHFHPWTDRQGQSPFVWSVLGAIGQATRRLVVGTAVTCPTVRMHPAIVAHAAATTAALMPGRFLLGLGTGENLNEHIVGGCWPETEIRQQRLEEAIEVIRLLWQGGNQSHHGRYFKVENARLYTLPDVLPPLLVAVGGTRGAAQAGRLGDGMIGTDPDRSLLAAFDDAGGAGKPRYAELTVWRSKGMLASILRGYPITAGLAAAFVILLVTVPALRIVSALRGRQDTYVPLVTTAESYGLAADLVAETLERNGFAIAAAAPPWWFALPSGILLQVGKSAFAGSVAEDAAHFRGPDLEVTLYPNALLLRGSAAETARAHSLVIEAVTGYPDMFQTLSPSAQELERQIQRVWVAYRVNPEAHENAPALLARLDEITLEMTRHPLPFEEWQVIYRQVLQLGRALTGHRQILEQTLPKESTMTPPITHSALDHEARSLSTPELVGRVLKTGSMLVAKEVELARAEIKADLQAEFGVLKLLIAAALHVLLGLNLLFVSAVLALTHWLPGWLAALGLAGMLLAIGFGVGLIGWMRRVSTPLAITRKTVKEDMQWAKERLA